MHSSLTDEPSRRTIVSFAAVMSAALLVLALVQRHRAAPPSLWVTIVAIAAALLATAFLVPRSLHSFYRAWMRLGAALGWINTRILLTLVFFLVVTPTGIVMRLFGRSPLATKRSESYWTDVEPHSYGDRHVEKQF